MFNFGSVIFAVNLGKYTIPINRSFPPGVGMIGESSSLVPTEGSGFGAKHPKVSITSWPPKMSSNGGFLMHVE